MRKELTANEERFVRHWEQRRQKGKINFILTEGVGFFIVTSLVMGIISYLMMRDEVGIWRYLAIQTIILLPGGILYAFFVWFIYENKYIRLIKKN